MALLQVNVPEHRTVGVALPNGGSVVRDIIEHGEVLIVLLGYETLWDSRPPPMPTWKANVTEVVRAAWKLPLNY